MASFNPSAPDTGGKANFELIPSGPTAARCARVIEIGVQDSKYGKQNRVVVAFSLPNHTIDMGGEEKQRFISNPFGINMTTNDGSTMYQYTKALNPNASNLGEFVGKPCQLGIAHYKKGDGNMGERIDSIAPIMPGYEVPELDTEPFWFEWDNPDPEVWGKIPEFTKGLIREAVNYPGSKVEVIDNGGPFKADDGPEEDMSDVAF